MFSSTVSGNSGSVYYEQLGPYVLQHKRLVMIATATLVAVKISLLKKSSPKLIDV